MKTAKLLAIAIGAGWLQIYFLGAMRPLGVVPNLLLVCLIYAGLLREASEAVMMALVGGLLLDLASGNDFGLRMGFYAVVTLAVVFVRQQGADFENLTLVLLTTVIGAVVFNLLVLAGIVAGHGLVRWSTVGARLGWEILLDMFLAVALRPLLVWLLRPTSRGLKVSS